MSYPNDKMEDNRLTDDGVIQGDPHPMKFKVTYLANPSEGSTSTMIRRKTNVLRIMV